MKIITRKPWYDKTVGKVRQVGEMQEVCEDRYTEITTTLKVFKNVTWVEQVEELPKYDEITVKEIKSLLDKKNIEYNSSDSKKDLYNLLTV